MNEQMEGKVIELDDTSIVAYLHYKGFEFTPYNTPSGRVMFRVHCDAENAVGEMYANPEVRVMDFIKCLKAVRSSMFTMKSFSEKQNQENKGE